MNPVVLNTLTPAPKSTGTYALLETESGVKISFLYNPERIRYSRAADYAPASTAGESVSAQSYLKTNGLRLELADLLLDSRESELSLTSLLGQMQSLLLPLDAGEGSAVSGVVAPETFRFSWNSFSQGPFVLTGMDWEETSWNGGEPVSARMNLSLLGVPDSTAAAAAEPIDATTVSLTERQREEGSGKGLEYLQERFVTLAASQKAALSSRQFEMQTQPDGVVTLSSRLLQSQILDVGNWDGYEFTPFSG